MRLVTYRAADEDRLGAATGGNIVDLSQVAPDMLTLIDQGGEGLDRARRAIRSAGAQITPLASATLLAPIPRPRKNIICLGMNYTAHAYESARARGRPEVLPEYPVFFTKAPTTVVGPRVDIPLHETVTAQLDWEVELALVISRLAQSVPEDRAMEYVYGYTILNDVSARDLQTWHQQFFLAKSLDRCGPMGPCLVTTDEIHDPHHLGLRLRLNGRTMQDSSTADLIFRIPAIIATLSAAMTLEPGDIISTGTPAGVGMGMTPPVWLQDGDVMEAEVDGIGVLRNAVRQGAARW
jgi:2-keto-4-pentenoate hydratase/2-oxohepta-3-ene-1,7-dioic acid hydratase in catechol pathway